MKPNTPEFIHRYKILCQLVTPKLGTEVFVQVNSGSIYGLIKGIITEFPGGRDGWDYQVRVAGSLSEIRFTIGDVVDVIGNSIFLGQR